MNNRLASNFISDENLSKMIQKNISFVEKYIDSIDSKFDDIKEKQIVYRELGSIVLSCVEALLKTLLVEIKIRCKKEKCNDKECSYFKYKTESKINNAKLKEIIDFLMNARLFWFQPTRIEKIYELIDLRNYIHISKNIAYEDKSDRFNKEYVECMLDLYYDSINQYNLNEWYFTNENLCLKILDENGYEETEKLNVKFIKNHFSFQIIQLYFDLFNGEDLDDEKKNTLSKLRDSKFVDKEEIANFFNEMLKRDEIRYENNIEGYKTRLLRFNKIIDKYSGENNFILKHSK